jgi:hypothetical protein
MGCLKQHIEWFKISPTEAIRIIQKWSKWIETSLYQSGVLKEEERRRAANIGEFMKEISAASIER